MGYREKIEEIAKNKQTNIVLALDFPFERPENRQFLIERAERVLDAVHPYICAVKINHHLILPLGLFDGLQRLLRKTREKGLVAIVDSKINDIGETNWVIAEYYFTAGFDALIANPFVGWEEGLKPVFEIAKKNQKGVLLLTYMSHKGAGEGYGQTVVDAETGFNKPQYYLFALKALKWGADGVVVGATYPEKIKEINEVLGGKIPIYSPGIGPQGGIIEAALRAGARFLIVGRAITLAENPAESAEKIRNLAWQCLTARC
ncbi:MAG: orotidine 5'-phosphate decarboxylase [Candidatus Bathyarchaeota archaeon]|nr:orotidine 5'-phosphate decarboxylase [Candidatus Bathyarchaeota archaeon]